MSNGRSKVGVLRRVIVRNAAREANMIAKAHARKGKSGGYFAKNQKSRFAKLVYGYALP